MGGWVGGGGTDRLQGPGQRCLDPGCNFTDLPLRKTFSTGALVCVHIVCVHACVSVRACVCVYAREDGTEHAAYAVTRWLLSCGIHSQ